MRGLPWIALPVGLVGCSSSLSGTLNVVLPVGEADTLTRDPPVATLLVDAIDSTTGASTTLARAPASSATVDLGSIDPNTTATLTIAGLQADATRVVFGESLLLQLGALDGTTLPIFTQRTGELAQLPAAAPDSRSAPTLAVLANRYLVVAGGSDPSIGQTAGAYDFAQLAWLQLATVPRAPLSVVVVPSQTVAWMIDDTGATAHDFSGQTADAVVTPPAGGTFADVAGGATIVASDGTQYLVGATRTSGAATASVLVVPSDTTVNPSWMFLTEPRFGATAAWVPPRGLVVAGGSVRSTPSAGAEILDMGSGSTTGSALPYPTDASTGAGATALDGQRMLLAGGVTPSGADAGLRVVDLGCSAACSPLSWGSLPTPLATAQAFASDAMNALVIGNEPGGATHAYRVTSTTVVEIPTPQPHTNARAMVSPVGSVVLFGGASDLESFFP